MIDNALHHIPIAYTNIFDLLYQYKIVHTIHMPYREDEIIFIQLRNQWLRY